MLKIEEKSNIKFIGKLEQKNSEIIEALQEVYVNNAPKKPPVYKR